MRHFILTLVCANPIVRLLFDQEKEMATEEDIMPSENATSHYQ